MASYAIINPAEKENSVRDPFSAVQCMRLDGLPTSFQNALNTETFVQGSIDDTSIPYQNGGIPISVLNPMRENLQVDSTSSPQIDMNTRLERLRQGIREDIQCKSLEIRPNMISPFNNIHEPHYSTKKPYQCPTVNYTLSMPPTGYKPINVQLIARHGSRTLASTNYDIQTLRVWNIAKNKNMLTLLGEELEGDVGLFMEANNQIGRGELTQLGKDEHFALGVRLYDRLQSLFASPNTVSVMTSGKKRAVDSSQEFLNGFKQNKSNIQIVNEKTDKQLIYFHKSDVDYLKFKKNDPDVKAKLFTVKQSKRTKSFARKVLEKIYQKEFVEWLSAGNLNMEKDDDIGPDEKLILNNEVDVAVCLHSLFSVAPAFTTYELTNLLYKYFDDEQLNWFAYISDAEEFYEKGPSIEGTTITCDMAKPLLTDFFSSVSACIDGKSTTAASLRFTHAEEIIPLASLLKIPGWSDQATHSSDLYTYENNSWRGDKIAPMTANIQWEVYRHNDNHNQILVRMLYNEIEVKFKEDCQSMTPGSYFYDFNELKRSYSNLLIS